MFLGRQFIGQIPLLITARLNEAEPFSSSHEAEILFVASTLLVHRSALLLGGEKCLSPGELSRACSPAVQWCLAGITSLPGSERPRNKGSLCKAPLVLRYLLVHRPKARYLAAGTQVAPGSLKKSARGSEPRSCRGLFIKIKNQKSCLWSVF